MTKGRILVVDDDRLVLTTVTHGLAQAGYDVIDADNGDDAILAAREHRPDLALLDIRMEGKSGFDVAEYLRDVGRVPFMFLSAYADDKTIAQVHALGAIDYLVKPVDVARIVPAVDAAMRRVREQGAGAAPAVAAPGPAAAPDAARLPDLLSDPVPLAVGVLMHRHALSRQDALARLRRMAHDQGLALAAQAERLLGAVEELARSSLH
jgi:response regulator NasT